MDKYGYNYKLNILIYEYYNNIVLIFFNLTDNVD